MKILGRLVSITLLLLASVFGVVVMAISIMVIYRSEPHIEVTEMRSASMPQTVEVDWYLSCEAEHYVDQNSNHYDPQVPIGGVFPSIGPVMSSGARFVLVGYPYKAVRRNIFTGSVDEQRSERFDVVEWHVAKIYGGEEDVESNTPRGWKSNNPDAQFLAKVDRRHKGDC